MEEIEKKINIVLEMLQSEIAWEYQRLKSSEPKSIDAFVARNIAKAKAKELIQTKVEAL
tara:strand:- start:45 stop:221 length:177 start_codon:yes stop_codon:yes gene_type:complete